MGNKKKAVLKFGGSVLRSQIDFESIRGEIQRLVSSGFEVVVVVSAYYGVTESLITKASKNGICPSGIDYAELIASGEFESALDLATYLVQNGLNAAFHTPAEFSFIAAGSRESAIPLSLNANKIVSAFDKSSIIVMPGFSAIDEYGDIILLGRGGSDISAVCVADALGLESVRLLKDVDGLYDVDPNIFSHAKRFTYIDYDIASKIGGALIQTEAIEFAATKNICIDIAAIGKLFGSRIGPKKRPLDLGHVPIKCETETNDQIIRL